MAEHFLTKTRVDLDRCIDVAGTRAVEQYAELYSQLAAKSGPDLAKLFAEPLVSKGNDKAASTISWYSDRPGEGVPLDKLDAAAQQKVGALLAERLKALSGLLEDTEVGALVAAALHIGSNADIWTVNGEPVLVNWGLFPERGSDAATRSAHYAATLGKFCPMETAPPQ